MGSLFKGRPVRGKPTPFRTSSVTTLPRAAACWSSHTGRPRCSCCAISFLTRCGISPSALRHPKRKGSGSSKGAVRLLQSIVERIRPNEQLRLIANLEASIIGMRGKIREIDAEIEKLARAQLSIVPGERVRPAELAAAVVAARDKHQWFSDRPAVFAAASMIADEAVARMRDARIALSARIDIKEC
jgi:hypothetical protein